jgi:hypothetical protein
MQVFPHGRLEAHVFLHRSSKALSLATAKIVDQCAAIRTSQGAGGVETALPALSDHVWSKWNGFVSS